MAVPDQIPVVNYVSDGVVKKFDVSFEYDQQSDLHLYVDGVEPTIDKYFFADNAFNFYIAPTVGQDVKIKRTTPKERDTDYDLHTNTVRPKALNSDFDRLWYALQEVFSDVDGLPQAVQDETIARIQGDKSVSEDSKNYTDNMIALIIGDPSFTGIDAKNVNDASGETQQQVNYNGGSKWHSRVGGYQENERVVLTNGDIVRSTIDGNANDPNVDMTGWAYSSLTPSNNLSDVADKAEARTNLDVYSKTETNTAITNATKQATESIRGQAKIATTAIAQAGTNDTDIITAKKLAETVFGIGQTIKVGSYIANTTYTNTTPKLIFVSVSGTPNQQNATTSISITVNGILFSYGGSYGSDGARRFGCVAPVPPGASWSYSSMATANITISELS